MARIWRILPVALFLTLAMSALAQFEDGWRSWTVQDGMLESYIRHASRGINGEIWARHGLIGKLSILDGGRIRTFEAPPLPMEDWLDWRTQVWPDGNGGAYTAIKGEILHHGSQKNVRGWVVVRPKQAGETLIEAIPRTDGSICAIYERYIEVGDPKTGTWQRIQDAERGQMGLYREATFGFAGEIWIAGKSGIGRLSEQGAWVEKSTQGMGLSDLDHPLPGQSGELLVSGTKSGKRATVSWRAGALELVADNLAVGGYGWRGTDESIWLMERSSLSRLIGNRKVAVARKGRLASEVFGIVPEPTGGFWMATVDGLLHRGAGLWMTPPEVEDVTEVVHDIVEDSRGRIWFAATDKLILNEGKEWKKFLLPGGIQTHNLMSRALMPLADGRLWLKCTAGRGQDEVMIFDPQSGRFTALKAEQAGQIRLFRSIDSETSLLRTGPGEQIHILKNGVDQKVADLTDQWKGGTLKDVVKLSDGRFWLAGAGGGGILDRNHFQEIEPSKYPWDSGFFSLWPDQRDAKRLLIGGRMSLMEWSDGQFKQLHSGLDRVRSLMKSQSGTIWMATASGIFRFENGELIANGEQDGLPSNMGHKIFEDSRGRVWAGTAQGISLYWADRDRAPPETTLKLSRVPLQASASGAIQLKLEGQDKWKQTESSQLLYSWRLDEGPWSRFEQTTEARLEGLKGGKHKFEVRSMDRNGNQERIPKIHWFEVPVPWHRETAFLMLAASMMAALLTLMVLAFRSYRERGLMVEKLSRARKEAEAASRQKSLFLANMSHEIRTPMNAILGMNQLALETPAGPEQREYLRLAHASAGELLNLLNDILDLSKVEAGKLELSEEVFDPKACTEGVVSTLGLRAIEKGLKLQTEFAEALPEYIRSDEHRLKQVLLNLVGNAVKFTETGEILVRLYRQRQSLHWAVTDTGIGIPVSQQNKIFQPFEQADGTATRKHGGTGLGLAISAELVRKMGGDIWVESPWRRAKDMPFESGSTFHFTLPLVEAEAPEDVPAVEGIDVNTNSLRVLVAEDNLTNQKLIDRLLARDGHTVRLVVNGVDALAALAAEPADLVLMDVQMPLMDGIEATRRIRERELREGGHLKIVAVTANALDGDREKCLMAGMDGFLTKPIQLAELRQILKYTVRNVDSNRSTGN